MAENRNKYKANTKRGFFPTPVCTNKGHWTHSSGNIDMTRAVVQKH